MFSVILIRLVTLWIFTLVLCLNLYAEIPNHKIYYQRDPRVPLTHIEIVYLGGGYRQKSEEYIGISRIMAKMFFNAAKNIGIVEQLENLGTDLDVKVDEETFTIALSMLSKNFRKTLEITNHLINNLSFSEEDLEQAKKQQAAEYEFDLENKSLELMVRYALYEKQEEGKRISLKALREIQLEDIKSHYSKLIRAQTVFFKVISDLDYDTIDRCLSSISQKRQNDGLEYNLDTSKKHKSRRNICYIFDYPQSSVDYCFWLIPIKKGENSPKLGLIMTALANNASGILFRHFREHLQLCYTTYGINRRFGHMQYIEICADPPENKSRKLIPEMFQYIQSLHKNQIFDSDIDELKRIYKNSYPFKISPIQRLQDMVIQDLYGVPILDEYTFREQVDNITREQIHIFLTNIFRPENFIMIFAGDSERINNLIKEKLHNVSVEIHKPFELIE